MTCKLLTILIPTLPDRKEFLDRLMTKIQDQATDEIEVMIDDDTIATTGAKRNRLIDQCETEWCVFIDDDDLIADDYIEKHLRILRNYPKTDAIGFKGKITTNGRNSQDFIIKVGLNYVEDKSTGKTVYLRPINHICVIRTEIARKVRFPDLIFAEDYDYAIRLAESGLIKDHEFIDEFMYYYLYRSQK
jgi:glycosyltransferase involved in cell wall biosynthesis